MILVIDAGNTRTKWAVFDPKGQLLEQGFFVNAELSKALALASWQNCYRAVVASVAHPQVEANISELLSGISVSAHWLKSGEQALGLKNGYQFPAKLGIDRWAAMLAAWKRHAHQGSCLVVNAGTALTIDAIHQNEFIGGVIAPGLAMMRQSLMTQTALVNDEGGLYQNFPLNTPDASHSGALNAAAGAVLLQFNRLVSKGCQKPALVLSGGDAPSLVDVLQDLSLSPMLVHNLVLEGLFLLSGDLK